MGKWVAWAITAGVTVGWVVASGVQRWILVTLPFGQTFDPSGAETLVNGAAIHLGFASGLGIAAVVLAIGGAAEVIARGAGTP